MIEDFKWLLKSEEIEFEKRKFRGKLAGKAHKYSKNLDGLVRTRILIFFMSAMVLYRVMANYLFYEIFDKQFFIERVVFAIILLVAGCTFNKARVVSIIVSVIPLMIITATYVFIAGHFNLRVVAFMVAITIAILGGIYNQLQSVKIKKELEDSLLENVLIEN